MRIVSWNVNGIRSCARAHPFLYETDADALCLQEVRADCTSAHAILAPRTAFSHAAERAGYSGVTIATKRAPKRVTYGIGDAEIDREGRVVTLEYPSFFLVNVYVPHSRRERTRLPFRLRFNARFASFCDALRARKPIVVAGDLNVAHTERDLARPRENRKNACFLPEERAWLDRFLTQGLRDSFRLFTQESGHYTWWTHRNDARARNIGWRLDYILVDTRLRVRDAGILASVRGSDHAPVFVDMDA